MEVLVFLMNLHSERKRFAPGTGDWRFFEPALLPTVFKAAEEWKRELTGVAKPWLCWNVANDWCLVQQKQVESVGWTPVVGYDPRVGPPPLTKNAVMIDFNKYFGFPTMWMHFPIEFAHLFSDRLAFWHADLILRHEVAEKYARLFSTLSDGEVAATPDFGGLYRRIFNRRTQRYWEVLACTTRGASASQFEQGCGWWKGFFERSISANPGKQHKLRTYYWDCGVGILYWQRRCGGHVIALNFNKVNEGHCTGIGRNDYKRASPNCELRNLSKELSANFDLIEVCRRLGVTELLDQGGMGSGQTGVKVKRT
jgi:hypothetical protein